MAKESIKIGIANLGETNIDLDIVKEWNPKDINYFSNVVFSR